MNLAGSYANGFAPRDGIPLYPDLWCGCVGAWGPWLGPTGQALRDWSGGHNHAELIGVTSEAAWAANRAITFSGASQYADCGRLASIESVPHLTVSAWLRRSSTGSIMTISKRTSGSVMFYFGFGVFAGSAIYLCPTSTVSNYGTYAIDDTDWHHVVMLFDGDQATNGTRLRLILDGREELLSYTGTVAALTTASTANLLMSRNNTTYSNGSLDDLRIYNRTLSVNEALRLWSRRGIAYELASRRRSSVQGIGGFKAAWVPRQRLIIGGGV